jgi:hypothetical protein
MAGVNLYEQTAIDSVIAVLLMDQKAVVSGGTTAAVKLFEQHVDAGGGSLARVQVIEQRATYTGGANAPSGIAFGAATKTWTPYTPFTSLAGDSNWH